MDIKIKLDHSKESISEVISSVVIECEGENCPSEQEVKEKLKLMMFIFSKVDISMLIAFFKMKYDRNIETLSELTEIVFDELGYEKFSKFVDIFSNILEKLSENKAADTVTQKESESGEDDKKEA